MANKTYYKKGSQYVDVNGKAVMIAKGNQLTFTDYFDAGGGGGELPVASASTLGGVKVGDGLNVTAGGVLSVAPSTYSTEKYDTGRKWIDGRIIYGKVFTISALSSTSAPLEVDHNENIDIVTHLHGTAKNTTTGTNFPLPYVSEDNINSNIRVAVTSTQLSIANATDRSMLTAYIVIEFVEPTSAETDANTRSTKKTVKKG